MYYCPDLLFLISVVAVVPVDLLRVVSVGVLEGHVGLALHLLLVDGSVQVVVHEVVAGRLLADVVVSRRHTDQVDL